MKNPIVTKHNRLIEARYSLTEMEQKILFFAISKINPSEDQNEFVFSVQEFAEFYGLKINNAYVQSREALDKLYERTIKIVDNKQEIDTRWIGEKSYLKGEGVFGIVFTRHVMNYLTFLESEYTRYSLTNLINLSGIHAIQLYELMAQYKNIGERSFGLEELKEILQTDYRNDNFFGRIIEPALKEINANSNLEVSLTKIKKGRKIDKLHFSIKENKPNPPYICVKPTGKDQSKDWAIESLDQLIRYDSEMKERGLTVSLRELKIAKQCYEVLGDQNEVNRLQNKINNFGKVGSFS